ncbi:hypothetical protein H5399_05210 [Tessaracoccus sp. MC1627]|uniref:hypothetical protein n=1 Tax=Tessaracoccus sp. MC1627 TaxID=2760312 RepID=UPI0015FFC73E|nr:hypothetical protein [Tessaracoccus sp. MC1627]MBB1512003.1 hypothetical protein [Tessaracoccus sp. MC1627]
MTAAEWIAERRELLDAATEGPWVAEFSGETGDCVVPHDAQSTMEAVAITRLYHCAGDANLIADARTSLPAALDALEAVLAEHERGHFGPILGFRCRRCITGSAGYAVPSPWPCGTVTAIESALRGES